MSKNQTGSGGCIFGVIAVAVGGTLILPELKGLIIFGAVALVIGFIFTSYNK